MTAVKTAMWAVPITNMIGVMIHDYCGRAGVEIAESSTPLDFRTELSDTFRRDRSNSFPTTTLYPIGHIIL